MFKAIIPALNSETTSRAYVLARSSDNIRSMVEELTSVDQLIYVTLIIKNKKLLPVLPKSDKLNIHAVTTFFLKHLLGGLVSLIGLILVSYFILHLETRVIIACIFGLIVLNVLALFLVFKAIILDIEKQINQKLKPAILAGQVLLIIDYKKGEGQKAHQIIKNHVTDHNLCNSENIDNYSVNSITPANQRPAKMSAAGKIILTLIVISLIISQFYH